jgi:hypothetical protein
MVCAFVRAITSPHPKADSITVGVGGEGAVLHGGVRRIWDVACHAATGKVTLQPDGTAAEERTGG